MPEYLAPGVYIEEVSFRAKSIEGVPTSTTGFVGLARFGPVPNLDGGPSTSEPRLITSFTEFEHVYGGLEPLDIEGQERVNYLGHSVRAFFLNGGKRLYVSRVCDRGEVARKDVPLPGGGQVSWKARWPGEFGNVGVSVKLSRSGNILALDNGAHKISRATVGSVVEQYDAPAQFGRDEPVRPAQLAIVTAIDDARVPTLQKADGSPIVLGPTSEAYLLELEVIVLVNAERRDRYTELSPSPDQTRYIGRILELNNPQDENAVVYLKAPSASPTPPGFAIALLQALTTGGTVTLTGGTDGKMPDAGENGFAGKVANPDNSDEKATGLEALGEIDDIAIVAIPDAAKLSNEEESFTTHQRLIRHCEKLKYRIAIIDGPENASLTRVRAYRGKFDTKYAAFYHPWIEILNPLERATQGAPPRRILLPPSGFVAGIYARSDIERGVHKAPANEVVHGLTRFESNINTGRNEVLNPEGINALRFFEGRGNRVWGARTLSSDPEWKYVNVRRLFIYLEHSIDKSTQWAVFEPNNERLWANIRRTIEDFLLVQWKDGALVGDKPGKAFFVHCDRTTMTQNDLDNGRLIVLIGVAPATPAEFVIFRIGQWTGDAISN